MDLETDEHFAGEIPASTNSLQHLPSDFSDLQDPSYDPEFISDIGSKMQVPERLAPVRPSVVGPVGDNQGSSLRSMTVPDRIIVTGQDRHMGMRSSPRQFNFDSHPTGDADYVNLITPPRVLTVQERNFSLVENTETKPQRTQETPIKRQKLSNGLERGTKSHRVLNQIQTNAPPATEDDFAALQTKMAVMARRIASLEQDNERRMHRELFMYPLIFGYFVFKVFSWIVSSPR